MILIGSRALMFRAPQLLSRKPFDYDFIGYEDEIWDWCKENGITDAKKEDNDKKIISESNLCEFTIIKPESSDQYLCDLVSSDKETMRTSFGMIPNRDLLLTLKTSHKYLKNSPHFWKTALDYHRMKDFGCKVRPEYQTFLKIREKETYNYAHPKLNVMKKDFFKDDSIQYVFEHDDLHKAVALYDRPAYTYYMKDGEQVLSDKNKFFDLPKEMQLAGVYEEAATLALERSQIPFPGVMTPKQSFMLALSKVCSSITSGWFREFAYEHIFEVVKMYNDNYMDKFHEGVKNGTVRKVGEISHD